MDTKIIIGIVIVIMLFLCCSSSSAGVLAYFMLNDAAKAAAEAAAAEAAATEAAAEEAAAEAAAEKKEKTAAETAAAAAAVTTSNPVTVVPSPPVVAPSPTGSRTYKPFPSNDFIGYDLPGSGNPKWETCETQCNNTPNCNLYQVGRNTCYLKNVPSSAKGTPNTDFTAYYTGTTPPTPTTVSLGSNYSWQDFVSGNNAWGSDDLPNQPITGTLDFCQKACTNAGNCIGFSRLKDASDTDNTQQCYLKKAYPNKIMNDPSWHTYSMI